MLDAALGRGGGDGRACGVGDGAPVIVRAFIGPSGRQAAPARAPLLNGESGHSAPDAPLPRRCVRWKIPSPVPVLSAASCASTFPAPPGKRAHRPYGRRGEQLSRRVGGRCL
jgi:hypothetical protein